MEVSQLLINSHFGKTKFKQSERFSPRDRTGKSGEASLIPVHNISR